MAVERERRTQAGADESAALRGPAMRSASLIESFQHAFRGISYALRTQRNMRFHCTAGALVLGLGAFLQLSPVELALLVIVISFVIAAELINTAVEAAVDLAAPYVDPLARVAKDAAAASVLLAASTAVVVGILVIGPHLLRVI